VGAEYHELVDVLETAGEPLTREELVDRVDLPERSFDEALDFLRGQQIVRRIPERDAYRLTYWPEEHDCALCGSSVPDGAAYELRLESPETGTDDTMRGSLHRDCAARLNDELSLEGL
jgi:hypothetical protein